uniref:Uncharacterized protein n=1 Tax=Rhizophora mucronata TaxID=61149 RepID=A0A2P2NYE7_RHIMU
MSSANNLASCDPDLTSPSTIMCWSGAQPFGKSHCWPEFVKEVAIPVPRSRPELLRLLIRVSTRLESELNK